MSHMFAAAPEVSNCTCSKKQPVPSFRETLTNQEGATLLACAGALVVVRKEVMEKSRCSAVELCWEALKSLA